MGPLEKLKSLGHELPPAPKPQGWYVPVVRSGDLVFVSGQLPMRNGVAGVCGKLGDTVSIDEGREAARLCLLNILAALEGNGVPLNSVKRVVKLTGYVQSAPYFHDQPRVLNAASEMMTEIFGESGRHARAAVGVAALPLNAAVEIEAIFEVA